MKKLATITCCAPGAPPLKPKEFESLSVRFKALADPTRLAIVNRLASKGDTCVCEFDSLGLITFFTLGPTEARAWTLRSGRTALDAAGEIHTDIARGFIRCEVIAWQDLVDIASRAEVRKRGLERLEGKDYVVREGDVINVRFNA